MEVNKILSLALSNKKNRIEILREFESLFKTALAHESGHQEVPFNEKKIKNLMILSRFFLTTSIFEK
jgi:hypothetical protein